MPDIDISLTPPPRVIQTISQTGHGFVVGDVIRVSGTNTYAKAQANSEANSRAVGIVSQVVNANEFVFTSHGKLLSGVPAEAAGTVMYLSASAAGALTSTAPAIVVPILVVVENAVSAIVLNALQDGVGSGGSGIPIADAGGTVNAITASYSIMAFADKSVLMFVAAGANTTTTPTFSPDSTTPRTITKNGGQPLLPGDIAGAGAVCIVEYNFANSRWELLNPAYSIADDAIVVSGNITAINDRRYTNVANATYTDPTPAEGKGFIVFVRNGTATVGGTAYAIAGTVIHRIYHSGAWANYKYQEIGALTANRSLLLDASKDLKSDGIGETRAAYNSTTQAVTSASETDITALVLSVEANKKYLVEIAIATECSGASGIVFGHKFPTGSTFKLTHSGRTNAANAIMNLGNVYTANTGLINNPVNTAASATGSYVASCFLATTNAGNYQLTFASASGLQTSTIREYGHIKLTEIP